MNCKKRGHSLANCPEAKKDGAMAGCCFNCGETAHTSKNCPHPEKDGKILFFLFFFFFFSYNLSFLSFLKEEELLLFVLFVKKRVICLLSALRTPMGCIPMEEDVVFVVISIILLRIVL